MFRRKSVSQLLETVVGDLDALERLVFPRMAKEPHKIMSKPNSKRVVSQSCSLRVRSDTSASKAGLLMGYPELASISLKKHNLQNITLSKLISIGSMCTSYKGEGEDLVEFKGNVIAELAARLVLTENVHRCGTTDLVSGVSSLALLAVSSSLVAPHLITRALKKSALELVRRIELYTISPHSAVDLIQTFSGLPPCPIHPLLLQAIQAFLLENRRFKSLSRFELAIVLHAMGVSEMENTILSREIVRFLVAESTSTINNIHQIEDPRTELRLFCAASILKSYFPNPFIRSLSCGLCVSAKDKDDISMVIRALSNLAGSNGVCKSSIYSLIETIDLKKLDLIDSASFLLLQVLASSSISQSNRIVRPSGEAWNKPIPESALEITRKFNPALPASVIRGRRLSRKAQERTFSMLDSADYVWSNFDTVECTKCSEIVAFSKSHISKTVSHLLSLIKREENLKEVAEAGSDILSAICFFDLDNKDEFSLNDLREINDLVSLASVFGDLRKLQPEEDIDDVESSVSRIVRSFGMSLSVNVITNSQLRITLVC